MNTNVHPVDQLGSICAQMAELKIQADALKAEIAKQGAGAYEGAFFRAVVSCFDRDTLPIADAKARLIEKFGDGRWVRDHTRSESQTTVRTYARSGDKLAA